MFISLDADDVIYQDGGSAYLNAAANAAPETDQLGRRRSRTAPSPTTTATPVT